MEFFQAVQFLSPWHKQNLTHFQFLQIESPAVAVLSPQKEAKFTHLLSVWWVAVVISILDHRGQSWIESLNCFLPHHLFLEAKYKIECLHKTETVRIIYQNFPNNIKVQSKYYQIHSKYKHTSNKIEYNEQSNRHTKRLIILGCDSGDRYRNRPQVSNKWQVISILWCVKSSKSI